uniref:Uncharacterized protein n=1 Tax=Sinocyclocheilus grahami TaxID=75366 RepID=A0A672RPI6_SINGR
MVCSKQQYNANSPVYNIQVHISNKKAGARKRRLDDPCFDETCETPLKRQMPHKNIFPGSGILFHVLPNQSPGIDTYTAINNIKRHHTASVKGQSVCDPCRVHPSVQLQTELDRSRPGEPPSQILVLKWDRKFPAVEISLRASLNFDICSFTSFCYYLLFLPNDTVSACAFGHSSSSAICSKVTVPDNTKTTSKPVVFCEEEWERRKKTYVESVKRHMKEKGACKRYLILSESGEKSAQIKNYLQSHSRCQLVSLDKWQKRNHLSHRCFAKVPDIFHRSPML